MTVINHATRSCSRGTIYAPNLDLFFPRIFRILNPDLHPADEDIVLYSLDADASLYGRNASATPVSFIDVGNTSAILGTSHKTGTDIR